MDDSVLLRVAVIENKPEGVKLVMYRGVDVNSVVSKSGPTAGYTALHWAAAKGHFDLVKMLVKDYKAEVNSVARDGIQPLHLAAFLGNLDVLNFLLESGADTNATFRKDVQIKYARDSKWSDDFGDKMSLLTFAAFNNKSFLASFLMDHGADFEVRSGKNKTLLMCAIEKDNYEVAQEIALKMKSGNLLNARDDDGQHVVHYFLHNSKFRGSRFDGKQNEMKGKVASLVNLLIDAGADVDATINGDPETLLANMAAYRCFYDLLKALVNLNRPLHPQSRALKYATLPADPASGLDEESEICTRWILKDLVLRRSFGMFVPEEEKQLMDELVAKNHRIKEIVRDFEQRFVGGFLEKRIIDGSSLFQVAKNVMKRKNKEDLWGFFDELQEELDENDGHLEGIDDLDEFDVQNFINVLINRFERAAERRLLMEQVRKIRDLKKAIPLSYEAILEILEYLDNKDLGQFIRAFYI